MWMTAIRRRCIIAVALTCGAFASIAACGSTDDGAGVPTSTEVTSDVSVVEHGLGTLARLAGERVMTADLVAAAKWGTDQPIDDPAREKSVLDTAYAHAIEQGADPATVLRVFEDQITANKTVQRGLHMQWQAQPADAPTYRPDSQTYAPPWTASAQNSRRLCQLN